MLYRFLKITMRMAVKIFFKEIHIHGLENIPKNKPVIFAANHNSAFMDAILVAVFIDPQIYFLARSDVFNTPFKKWILSKMNLLPIYRLQEGAENLHKNEQVFKDCFHLLSKKKSILIFSEGICIQEKRLQKLKKGTARIAFGAEFFHDFKLDLQVVPVGINYTKPSQFRSKINLRFAQSIQLSDYKQMAISDPNKASYNFTRNLEKAMEGEIIHLTQKSNDELYELVTEIYENSHASELTSATTDFNFRKKIGYSINNIQEDYKNKLTPLLNSYFKTLNHLGLKDKNIVKFNKIKSEIFALELLILILGFPLHILALLINYPAYKVPYWIAQKTCKHKEFVASVMIGTAAVLFIVTFIFYGVVFANLFSNIYLKISSLFIAPVCALYALHYYSFLKKLKEKFILIKEKKTIINLLNDRNEIELELNQLIQS